MNSGAKIGLGFGVLGLLVGVVATVLSLQMQPGSDVKQALTVSLDQATPYLIVATPAATKAYGEAILLARKLHPDASVATLEDSALSSMQEILSAHAPRYTLVFLLPDELDVHFAWNWLTAASRIDDDPFVDTSTGFMTGESPAAVLAFMHRIEDALAGRITLPGKLIDNLGPNEMAASGDWQQMPGSYMLPVFTSRLGTETISHGTRAFTVEHLQAMNGAGVLHYGGHGYPDRVVGSLNGPFVRKLALAPNVFFNGACYTGVTGRWFDNVNGRIRERQVKPELSFALGVLGNNSVAYLAALHPDHGIPVYQEMEYLAWQGGSLGDVMRYTHNGVVMGNGGRLPAFDRLRDGMRAPNDTPESVMLKGTAARVLFGDPAMTVMAPFSPPPFTVHQEKQGTGAIKVVARTVAPELKASYADTFHADLSRTGQFNDRAWIVVDLPDDWVGNGQVEVQSVRGGDEDIAYRLIGYALELDGGKKRMHVQIDTVSTGYLEGPLRQAGASVMLQVSR